MVLLLICHVLTKLRSVASPADIEWKWHNALEYIEWMYYLIRFGVTLMQLSFQSASAGCEIDCGDVWWYFRAGDSGCLGLHIPWTGFEHWCPLHLIAPSFAMISSFLLLQVIADVIIEYTKSFHIECGAPWWKWNHISLNTLQARWSSKQY